MAAASASVRYRFGRFDLQPAERLLLADGVAVRLGPHAFDVLVALVARSGHLITKDDLLALVWGKVVVEENTLQAHIAAVRKVVGPDSIVTVSGRGYRFVQDVECIDAPSALRPVPARRHNLPSQLTSFVGREEQIAQITDLLRTTRLCTLSGAGGCGKTRLALKVASDLAPNYADGVWLAELASLSEPSFVQLAVAKALGVKDQPGTNLEQTLADCVGSRHMLLVLDNAEHVLEACAQVADSLLRRCDRLSILVTSRERLGIDGELTYRVPSLSLPSTQAEAGIEALSCEAARLFIERARLQRPGFDVARAEADALTSICRRLDGIALAIELAAPRVRHMTIRELNNQLDHRFEFLTGGPRTAMPRHRTLRALIDWSYDLLDDSEKAALRRVSVFAGGWTLESAQRVCSDGGLCGGDVLDLLASLADKNLIVTDLQRGVTRYAMLETVRQYARGRLAECNEELSVRARQTDYLLELAEQVDAAPSDEVLAKALDTFDDELENVRSVLAWCVATENWALKGLDLAGRLYWFWIRRGATRESKSWIERLLLATAKEVQAEAHAKALHVMGTISYMESDLLQAEQHHRGALAIWRRLGERQGMMRSIGSLGNVMILKGDYASTRMYYEEALGIAREIGDRRRIATAMVNLANLYNGHTAEYSKAQTLLEECIPICRDIGPVALGEALEVSAFAHKNLRQYTAARSLLRDAVVAFRAGGDMPSVCRVLVWLASVSVGEGDAVAARASLCEALEMSSLQEEDVTLNRAFEAAAFIMTTLERPLDAARMLGAVASLKSIGISVSNAAWRQESERLMANARSAANDDVAFQLAWSEGKSWSVEETLQFARERLR